ncbi:transcription factor grauzone [Aedes aegypti]|uniref:C2H2-type domain-containing protein n=1 Tax=Aedes aegypti TaxID=7159 RepID=A0A1S4FJR8_AEDAE|nr:transcription factor grauzone [Aedes aegypti]
MATPDCLTCIKSIDPVEESLTICDHKDVQNALNKHFWFTENQYIQSTLCKSCWRQIEDFHRFYTQVEELHSHQMFSQIQLMEIKEEEEEAEIPQSFEPELEDPTKIEEEDGEDCFAPTKEEEDSSEEEGEVDSRRRSLRSANSASGSQQSKKVKRTRVKKKELDEVQEYVSKNMELKCDTCSVECKTFDDLQKHSMKEHQKRATVVCCDLKLAIAYRFVDHVRFHLNPNRFKCPQCTKRCVNRESLSRHVRTAHSPEPEELKKESVEEDVEREEKVFNSIGTKGEQKESKESDAEGDESVEHKDDRVEEASSGGDVASDDDDDYKQDNDSNESDSSGDDQEDEDSENDDRDNDSNYQEEEFQIGKRTRLKKSELAEIQEYVSKNMTLECDTCAERCPTFNDLQKHSMEKHDKRATVRCCESKLANSYRFVDHIRFHMNPDRFKCSHCEKQCLNRDALRRHVQKFHTPEDEKKYHCEVCFTKFSTRKALMRHGKVHEDFDPEEGGGTRKRKFVERAKRDMENEKMIAEFINLECDSCNKKFDTFLILQKHSMLEHKKLSYVFCCGQRFNKKPRLVDHVHFHLNPTKFQCKICQRKLPHTESLRRHMDRNHSGEAKTFKCSICPKMFTHKKFLSIHERWHNRRWHCEICDRRFICEAILKQHHKSVHTKELNYVCHVCAKTFHIYSTYRSHLESHDETIKKKPQKPPVQCQVCNAWTPKLSHHMRLHSGTRTCELCGQECKNIIAYRYHMKHHETGDHMCSVCGKGFKKELSLKEHMASHTGVTLYSCDFCDRTFNSNANRAAHRKKMHPQQWLEDKLKKKLARYGGTLPPEAMTV